MESSYQSSQITLQQSSPALRTTFLNHFGEEYKSGATERVEASIPKGLRAVEPCKSKFRVQTPLNLMADLLIDQMKTSNNNVLCRMARQLKNLSCCTPQVCILHANVEFLPEDFSIIQMRTQTNQVDNTEYAGAIYR